MAGLPLINHSWTLPLGLGSSVAVIGLVAWALSLMQAAIEQREFSLMLAGCLVCSAAVGLTLVMVMTLNGMPV
ncbi:MAG: hypothetical protein VKK03_06165 [Synechococcus sp.]|nr:hypothetical protein [Synechococcus sp.]